MQVTKINQIKNCVNALIVTLNIKQIRFTENTDQDSHNDEEIYQFYGLRQIKGKPGEVVPSTENRAEFVAERL